MTLPNAYSGVKKIFIAEILQIVGSVLAIISLVSVLGVAGVYVETGDADGVVGLAATAGIFALIAAGLAIVVVIFLFGAVGRLFVPRDMADAGRGGLRARAF